jgi:hypothetical protein
MNQKCSRRRKKKQWLALKEKYQNQEKIRGELTG